MSAPTTTEGIAAVMVHIAAEDLGRVIASSLRSDTETAIDHLDNAIRQLEAARRMLA